MAKGSSKSAAAIERLLEERRQYEAWLARIHATADSAPEARLTRVKAITMARLKAVMKSSGRMPTLPPLIAQRKETLAELQEEGKGRRRTARRNRAAPRIGVRRSQWAQVHKDALGRSRRRA